MGPWADGRVEHGARASTGRARLQTRSLLFASVPPGLSGLTWMFLRVVADIVILHTAAISRRPAATSLRLKSAIRLGPLARPHITLAMASVEPSALPELADALRRVAHRVLAFDVTLTGLRSAPGES